jgi:hypothetical protein
MGKLISIAEYAALHGKAAKTVQQKAQRGGFKTAQKIGRNWVIDSEEPYTDGRLKSGNYVGWRKK